MMGVLALIACVVGGAIIGIVLIIDIVNERRGRK
jgi:hypothetical protein